MSKTESQKQQTKTQNDEIKPNTILVTKPDKSLGYTSKLLGYYIYPYCAMDEVSKKEFDSVIEQQTTLAEQYILLRQKNSFTENDSKILLKILTDYNQNLYNNLIDQAKSELNIAQIEHNRVRDCESSGTTTRYKNGVCRTGFGLGKEYMLPTRKGTCVEGGFNVRDGDERSINSIKYVPNKLKTTTK